jgi:hypothetical protein
MYLKVGLWVPDSIFAKTFCMCRMSQMLCKNAMPTYPNSLGNLPRSWGKLPIEGVAIKRIFRQVFFLF